MIKKKVLIFLKAIFIIHLKKGGWQPMFFNQITFQLVLFSGLGSMLD